MAAEQELLNQELVGEIDLKEEGIQASIPATITSATRSAEIEASPEESQKSFQGKSKKKFRKPVQSALLKCQYWCFV